MRRQAELEDAALLRMMQAFCNVPALVKVTPVALWGFQSLTFSLAATLGPAFVMSGARKQFMKGRGLRSKNRPWVRKGKTFSWGKVIQPHKDFNPKVSEMEGAGK